MRHVIRFRRRGRLIELDRFEPRTTLLDWLRLDDRATGTKEGCAEGDCGACTVALRRRRGDAVVIEPVNACILFLGQVDGAEVLTVEDLAAEGALHPVQRAMIDHHGSQCGFCTPGIVMSLFVLHENTDGPVDRAAIDTALSGNLCRCTGYRPIVDAAMAASAEPRRLAGSAFGRLDDGADLFVGDDEAFFASPASLESALALYARHPDATIVAGATDVGLWVTKALADIRKIIWLGRIAGFDHIARDGDTVTIGAGATHAEASAHLAAVDPDLGEVMRRFGSVQVRASGTVGGNIANGSPIGDLAPCLIALGATLELMGPDGRRTLPLEDFFLAYRRQDRKPGELVTGLTVPVVPADAAFRAFKVSKRFDEDISAVMGAFRLTLDGRRVASARIAFGGMAGTPKRANMAETALAGADLDHEASWQPAIDALAQDYAPMSDQRASAAYRLAVAKNLLLKALAEIGGTDDAQTRLIGHREVAHAAE